MEPKGHRKPDPRRGLPQVDRLQRAVLAEAAQEPGPAPPDWASADGCRAILAEERERLAAGGEPRAEQELVRLALRRAASLAIPRPRRVVNATGIVIHTNLGRAPLAPGAAAALNEAATHYSDLELDLASGKRGNRLAGVAARLARLGGAEAALAVNNNAAAVLLALSALARGGEVVVSRGELVEIGGSFRIPEIMERAGVRLVEVGSTNRTHLADYERAIGPETRLLLKVHRSNFELRGFVSEVGIPELARLAGERGLPLLEDLGSGTLVEIPGLPKEAFAPGRVRLGSDLVCFSGDKLLGGPQAGLVLGRADLVERLRSDPLARALRLDKLSLAALDWTLAAYLEGRALQEIPVLRQLVEPLESLEQRARALTARLAKIAGPAAVVRPVSEQTLVGGGSLPGLELPSWIVEIEAEIGADRLSTRFREAAVPVLVRVRDQCVKIDVRTLLEGDEDAVEAAFAAALR